MMKKSVFLCAALFAFGGYAWDVEHDIIAALAAESLPREILSKWSAEDALDIVKYCHYPDCDEMRETLAFHGFSETEAIVGKEDAALLRAMGYSEKNPSWFHHNHGIAGLFAMLTRSFGRGDSKNAAFYFSLLTHTVSDRASLNHTPLLQWMYFRFPGVEMNVKSPCLPDRHTFVTFTPQGRVAGTARRRLAAREPREFASDLPSAAAELVARQAGLAALSAELEGSIAWGEDKVACDALVKLVVEQVQLLRDLAVTAWKLRKEGRALEKKELDAAENAYVAALAGIDPRRQAVWKNVFDETLNPGNPKGVVGFVCEAFAGHTCHSLSVGGRLITSASARTLRDAGYAVKAIDYRDVGTKGLPDPKDVPAVFISLASTTTQFSGRPRISSEVLGAIAKYRVSGGKLFVLGGTDPGGVTALRPYMMELPVEDRPVVQSNLSSPCADWRSLAVVSATAFRRTGGKPFPFVHDPSNGAAAPVCPYEITLWRNLLPLVWLCDNRPGEGQRLVGARSAEVMWLPEYLFAPFVLSRDTAIDWDDARLDSTGRDFLLDAVEELLFGPPLSARPIPRVDGWWNNGGVYKKHLEEIAAHPTKKFDLVLVGDSITHRWMQSDKGGQFTWPQLTKRFETLNLGIGADSTQHMIWRLENGELDGYTAKFFCVLAGVNNGPHPVEDVAEGIRRIVRLIREKHPESTVLLMPILPHGKGPAGYERTDRINDLAKDVVDGKKVHLFDIRKKMLDDKGYLLPGVMAGDNLHPVAGGYKIWFDELVAVIDRLSAPAKRR